MQVYRDTRLDLFRVVLILMVLCIHTFCVLDWAEYPQYRALGLVLNTICHYAVPCFVMLSGILMSDCCNRPLSGFYAKRLHRVAFPLLFFSLFFMAIRVFRDNESVMVVLKDAVVGHPYYHLWFGFMILGVYVLMPFLSRLVNEIRPSIVWSSALLVIYIAFRKGEGPYAVLPYSAYAIMGMLIARSVQNRYRSYLVTITAIVVLFVATVWNCRIVLATGSLWTIGYCSPWIMAGSISLMVFVLNAVPATLGGKAATSISGLVYGVYLFHPIAKGVALLVLRFLPQCDGLVMLTFPLTCIFAFGGVWIGEVLLRTVLNLLGPAKRCNAHSSCP